MKNVIIVFERPDIPSVEILQQRLQSSEVWVFDPHLLDDLARANIQNCTYVNLAVQFDVPEYSAKCQQEALEVERTIMELLQGPEESFKFRYWQHLSWHFLVSTLRGYPQLWDALLHSSLEDTYFHIPLCDKPTLFYAPSFLPAVMLMERLASRSLPFAAYAHSTLLDNPRFLPADISSNSIGTHDLFVHLPTCIYDSAHYATELTATGLCILNFESQNWNVPMPAFDQATLVNDSEVLSQLDEATQSHVALATTAVERWLVQYFGRFIATNVYAERQARHIAEQYRTQLIFFHFLENRFAQSRPRKIVLSNHDAGLSGPFLAFAEKQNIPIVMLAHAKVFNYSVPSAYTNIIAPTHPMQGGRGVATIEGKRICSPIINFPSVITHTYRAPQTLASVGLILNKFSADGMSLVDTDTYLYGLLRIKAWCQERGIELKIRVKPGGTCILWLTQSLGFTPEYFYAQAKTPIGDFAHAVDVCLMYDAPTGGAAELLSKAIPLLTVLPRALCNEEKSIVSDDIVPQISVESTLEQLSQFEQDPVSLNDFRSKQFRRYVDCATRGLPLRLLF